MSASRIIVFDGVCVLCNGWVDFLLKHDRDAHYRFAAMQSAAGRQLLSQAGLDTDDPSSFLLLEDGMAYTDSDAILRVLKSLGGLWRLTSAVRIVPARVRDVAYRWIARNRYRLFGRHDHCRVPTPEMQSRFL